MKSVLIDTGVWYAFFDLKDNIRDRETIDALAEIIENMNVLIPWPILYETISTRMSKNRQGLIKFEAQIKSPRTYLIDDFKYRDDALADCLESSIHRNRPLSMTDCLLRSMMQDDTIKIDYFATFNDADFIDIRTARNISLLSE